ncbi:MAG: hypothetical protein AAFX52_06485 [Pseudomonadota bacterium]
MDRIWIDRSSVVAAARTLCVALLGILLLAALSACSSSGGPPRGGGPGGPGGGSQAALPRVIIDPLALFYVGMDMDDDLIVSRAEFEDRAPIQFVRADTDGDNHLRPLELSAWVEDAIGTRDAPYGMGSFDRIPDGVITEAEFVGFLGLRFDQLDRNDDGQLERSEVARVLDASSSRQQQGGGRGGPPGGGQRPRR